MEEMEKFIALAHIDSRNRNPTFLASQDLGPAVCNGHLVPSGIHQSPYYHIQQDDICEYVSSDDFSSQFVKY